MSAEGTAQHNSPDDMNSNAIFESTEQKTSLTPKQPLRVIEPKSAWHLIDLRELWRFRDLLFALAKRDITLRYRQTTLGVTWVILQPLLAAGIFTFVFGRVAKLDSGGIPYFVFSYAGMLAWNVFNGTVSRSSMSLVGNSPLISKVFFPRLILPLSTVFAVAIDFCRSAHHHGYAHGDLPNRPRC